MEFVGAKLKDQRLKKGLSLEEVHKKTKIHLDILKAIEEDNFANLSPIYIKGFLKMYCQFLGVDPKDFIVDYKEPQDAVPSNNTVKKEVKPVVKATSVRSFSIDPKIVRSLIYTVVGIISILLFIFIIGKARHIVSRWKSQPKKEKIVSKQVPVKEVKKQLKSQEKKKPVVQHVEPTQVIKTQKQPIIIDSVKSEAVSSVISGIRLGIRAKNDCWVFLKVDGKTAFQNILKSGRFEYWQAKEKMEISVGNAADVEFELNGKLLPALGRKGQSLKNVLITKEGLKVQR